MRIISYRFKNVVGDWVHGMAMHEGELVEWVRMVEEDEYRNLVILNVHEVANGWEWEEWKKVLEA